MTPREAVGAAPNGRHPVKAAFRHAGTTLAVIVAALAAFLVTSAVMPTRVEVRDRAATVSDVHRLAVDHDCSATADPGKPMLLIDTPSGGARLIRAAVGPEETRAQVDWLTDQRAAWFGWCTP